MNDNEEDSIKNTKLGKLVEWIRFGGEYANKADEVHYQKAQQLDILSNTRIVLSIGVFVLSVFALLKGFKAPTVDEGIILISAGMIPVVFSLFIILCITTKRLSSFIPLFLFILAILSALVNDFLLLYNHAVWSSYIVIILGQILYFAVFVPNRYAYSLSSVVFIATSYSFTGLLLGENILTNEASVLSVAVSLSALIYKYHLNKRIRAYHEDEKRLEQQIQEIGFSRDLIESSASANIDLMEQLSLAEAAAKQNSSFLTAVLDHINQGIAVYNPNYKLVAWNEPFERLLEFPEGYLHVGLHQDDIIKYNAERGEYGRENTDEILENKINAAKANRGRDNYVYDRARADGTILNIIGTNLPDGSTITSYSDVTKQRMAEEEARILAMRDTLTNLSNRRAFEKDISNAIKIANASENDVVLAMIDLDNFKPINDSYGHPVGDEVLKKVAAILTSSIRDTDMAARIGGDEFTIVFHDVEFFPPVYERILSIIEAISNISIEGCDDLTLGASVGIAHYPRHARSVDELIKSSDKALYAAKHDGKNTAMLCKNSSDNEGELIFRSIKGEY